MQPNEQLRQELLALAAEDMSVREELAADGSVFEGYHPRMEAVHRRNAARLVAIIEQHGWPGRSLVGEDGAKAAWLIVQHSIGDAELQRRGLKLLQQAAAQGEVPLWQPAMLEDRIRVFEGELQIYGTQYNFDENGELSPYPIADPDHVDERRRAVGLGSLEEITRRQRERAAQSRQRPPRHRAQWQRKYEDWLRSAGWR